MDVRDAVEADADGLAAIADAPTDVMRNLIHDRTVRIAVERHATSPPHAGDTGERPASNPRSNAREDADETTDGETTDDDRPTRDAGADDPAADVDEWPESMLGFVSFDARPDAVHVTQLDGTPAACTRLLEEPLGFARRERMPVELLLPADSGSLRDAVEAVGFDELGRGPQFEGQPTVRYRFEP